MGPLKPWEMIFIHTSRSQVPRTHLLRYPACTNDCRRNYNMYTSIVQIITEATDTRLNLYLSFRIALGHIPVASEPFRSFRKNFIFNLCKLQGVGLRWLIDAVVTPVVWRALYDMLTLYRPCIFCHRLQMSITFPLPRCTRKTHQEGPKAISEDSKRLSVINQHRKNCIQVKEMKLGHRFVHSAFSSTAPPSSRPFSIGSTVSPSSNHQERLKVIINQHPLFLLMCCTM